MAYNIFLGKCSQLPILIPPFLWSSAMSIAHMRLVLAMADTCPSRKLNTQMNLLYQRIRLSDMARATRPRNCTCALSDREYNFQQLDLEHSLLDKCCSRLHPCLALDLVDIFCKRLRPWYQEPHPSCMTLQGMKQMAHQKHDPLLSIDS